VDKHTRTDSHSQTVRTTPGNRQKYPEKQSKNMNNFNPQKKIHEGTQN